MAAFPSQQTHWLKLRVDLGLERHSGMDPQLELDYVSCLSPPCSVMSCRGHSMYTHSRQTRGGGLEKSYAFFSVGQRRLCAVVGLLDHSKENVVERPLHELPQKVRDCVFFFYISHSPSPRF